MLVAYRLFYRDLDDCDETIGYYLSMEAAEVDRLDYATRNSVEGDTLWLESKLFIEEIELKS